MSGFVAPTPIRGVDRDPPVPASTGAVTDSCCALIVLTISNFPILRRHLGVVRANLLAHNVATRVRDLIPDAAIAAAGRDRVEIFLATVPFDVVEEIVTRLDAAFEAAFDVDGEPYSVELMLGAATLPVTLHDDVRLLDEAERACEAARETRAPVVRHLGRGTAPPDRASLGRDLRDAIGKGELFLQYQPKLHLRRQAVSGVEALIRWRHPVRGLVMPGDFIALAEESHDIVDLTVWTIQQVIKDQRVLAARGHDIPVFVNISGVLLSDARFVRRACALIQSSGVKIGFEITETAVIRDPQSAIGNLKRFADIGIVIAIDDYGAGLSSLAYLKQLPASELKIDKLFVTQLTSSNRDPLIVRSTIDLAHAMEMEVVAEGVETAAALALLSVMGCDVAQGFLISRPVDLPILLEFLAKDQARVFVNAPAKLLNLTVRHRRAS
jgi:EAL domain-containing protein (putative c-di-GMP-specific phosphodiesterase class I)/GGDEF domain-containing protein